MIREGQQCGTFETGKPVKTSRGSPSLPCVFFWTIPGQGMVASLKMPFEHAFVLCNRDQIEISDLPLELWQPEEECRPGGIADPAIR
jgi:hypothetical protein